MGRVPSGLPERRRVVVTGLGIVSCLGNTLEGVATALRAGTSGLTHADAYGQRGFGSQVAGVASVADAAPFPRKVERFMGETARFACHAAAAAIADAELSADELASPRTGAIIGSGVGAISAYRAQLDIVSERGVERAPAFTVPQAMSSTTSACVAHLFGVQGIVYSPSSACTTSALAIGQAMRLIESGAQDIVLAGGAEELFDGMTLAFDAMFALSRNFNDAPVQSSRPYDLRRDGFVIASGAGVVVLESLEGARARGATIYAELIGFGACTDPDDMVAPSAGGIARAIRLALGDDCTPLDYINTQAASTPAGDTAELDALREVFGTQVPPFSSTKGLTGHSLGATGAQEAIYTLLMMRDGFIAGCKNLDDPDPALDALPVVTQSREATLQRAMSVNFGFGGSCAALVFQQIREAGVP
jgi:3-oxoacyl-[acyl-carrier-protein] synthase I